VRLTLADPSDTPPEVRNNGMKIVELRALLCVECLLAVEKRGSAWVE
jgi:hypothetical protein